MILYFIALGLLADPIGNSNKTVRQDCQNALMRALYLEHSVLLSFLMQANVKIKSEHHVLHRHLIWRPVPATYLATSGVKEQIRDRLTHTFQLENWKLDTFQLEMDNSGPISTSSMLRNQSALGHIPHFQKHLMHDSLCDSDNNPP